MGGHYFMAWHFPGRLPAGYGNPGRCSLFLLLLSLAIVSMAQPSFAGVVILSTDEMAAAASPVPTIITVWPGSVVRIEKTPVPEKIRVGGTVQVNITISNPGVLLYSELEVTNADPPGLTVIKGEPSRTFPYLRPDESLSFEYTIRPERAGNFTLAPALVRVRDFRGEYHTVQSGSTVIVVLPEVTDVAVTQKAPGFTTVFTVIVIAVTGIVAVIPGWLKFKERR